MDEKVDHCNTTSHKSLNGSILAWDFAQGTYSYYATLTYLTNIGWCVPFVKMHWVEHGGKMCGDFQVQ
jgi:hypothetical protein